MIETYNNKTYRITYRGVSMIENALGNPNLVQISVVTGCTIMVAPQPTYGIDYLPNGEYRSWKITGQNTRINKKEYHHLYVRLSREGSDGMFVFSRNDYETDGKIVGNASSVASEEYYYIKVGFITATDGDGMTATVLREIQYDGGYLNTPQASESDPSGWEKLFTVTADNLINALKRFASFTVQGTLSIIGRLELGLGSGKYIEDLLRSTDEPDESNITDTTVPTALYVEEEMLHRKRPDNAEKVITFDEGLVSEGEAVFNGQVTAKTDINSPSFTSKRFVEGWIGEGGRLWYDEETGKSKLEVDEIRARDVFETLTFRFNQVDVISGEMWNTFSFGTIKSVDEKRKVVHLDLVEGERMTAHVNDLMRGIFHNIRTENNESDADDECGFPQIQGFSTSYFTPVGLLADGTGFRYALRPGTHVHPQAGMKFAAYGNFTDKGRQSSTYSTRTRLIMLEGVNTWVIDPSRHYTYVRGELNMEYGGMKFVGHGTIQKNSYIYGSQIFFTPKQLEDMKGNSAYSVNLSDYEGIINLDLDGNVVGGVKETFNVVTDGMNVTTDSETLNVVTQGYVLSTRIQAFKGETELFHSDTIEEGAFVVLLTPVGCTAAIENGIVEVTGISNPENCYIDMEVNCEGNAVFTKTYKISSVTNGYSPLYIDLDNEMDSVACDSDGTVLFGLPVVTNVSVFYGTKKLDIESLSCTADNGVVVQASKESGRVSVTYIPKNAPDTLQITITAKALYDGKEYLGTSIFTVNKVKTSAIYNLQPSVSSVKVGKDSKNNKVYEVSSVNCSVKKSDGTASSVISLLPDGYSMTYSTDGGSEKAYSYKSYINVESLLKTLKFFLYFDSTLVDVETVPIVIDGDNGESNVIADLDNEMDSVACDSSGNYLFGNPTTTVSMWYGSTQLTLDSLTLDADTGINATSNRSTGVVRVTSVDANAADVSQIRITLKATYNGTQYTRLLVFTINKVKTSAIYNLQPSVSSVKKTADNAYSVSSVSCSVRKNDGTATTTLSSLPARYTMKYSTDKGSQYSYTYGSSISVTSLSINVQFYLYYGSTLVDVETIPVVIDGEKGDAGEDGNGILSETVYYLISNKSTGITTATAGWSTSYPVMTAANRFLWTYTLIRYTNGTSKTDGPKLIGVYGDTGLQGCIMRMFENGITVGQTYRNDASSTSGIYRYIDHIAVQNDSYASGYAVYQCKVTHAATSVTEYTNTAYWTPVDQNVSSAFFSYLLAKNANIKLLSGAQFVVQEEKDGKITTVGGMQGDTRYPIIWSGSDEMGRTMSPFRVMSDGDFWATSAHISGSVVSGDENGQRIELNPDDKSVLVYDKNGSECIRMDGSEYTMNELIPGNTKNLSLVEGNGLHDVNVSSSIPNYSTFYDVTSRTSGSAAYSDKPAVISVDINNANVTFTAGGGSNYGAVASMFVVVETYSNSSYSQKIASRSMLISIDIAGGTHMTGTSGIRRFNVPSGYYLVRMQAVYANGNPPTPGVFRLYWSIYSVKVDAEVFMSRFFSNGISLTKSTSDYFIVKVESGNMAIRAASNGKIFDISAGKLKIEGATQPVTVYAARITDTSTSSSSGPTVSVITSIGYSVTVSKLSQTGHYTLSFPSTYGLSASNAIVTATGYGNIAGGDNPIKATVLSAATYNGIFGIEIVASDDASPNYGGFYIEVKRY